ncbi:MAG: methylenetetrahydrofolate reductase [NAD(P)H] [Prosthecobacter sp.]
MRIPDLLARTAGRTAISLEFFPPRTPAAVKTLQGTLEALAPLRPAFASVTYGAGGSTRDLTQKAVTELRQSDVFQPMPHLTCVGHTEAEIMSLLQAYARAGVGNILALRGDAPAEQNGNGDDFRQAADLVRFIRQFNERGLHPDPRGFGIGVACFPEGHPATPNRMIEMDHLKAKVDAGADFLITQAFFDNHDFHDFRARCELAGMQVPILAGILPLTTEAGMRRMAELAGGMRYPAGLIRGLRRAGGDAEMFRRIALHHATEQCADLLHHGVNGVHFYTLNQSAPVLEIHTRLGLAQHRSANGV